MTQPATAREAADRNARAIMEGNLSQLMADITPEVMAQVMAMGSQAPAGLSIAQMPNIQGYELVEKGQQGDSELFDVTFRSDIGTATIAASWKQVMGQWKIVNVALVSAELAQQ